jgi:hypothetical protein
MGRIDVRSRLNRRGRPDRVDRARLARLDFRLGIYEIGGKRYDPATIFGDTVGDGNTSYQPANIVAGSGLVSDAVTTHTIGFIGDLRTLCREGRTFVVRWEQALPDTTNINLKLGLFLQDTGHAEARGVQVDVDNAYTAYSWGFIAASGLYAQSNSPNRAQIGRNCFAATLADVALMAALNGSLGPDFQLVTRLPMDEMSLFHSLPNCTITSLDIYRAVFDSKTLQHLSHP